MRKKPKVIVSPIVRQIVGNLHIGESEWDVLHHVVGKLKNGRETFMAMPLADRRDLVRQVLKCHKENRREYFAVMSGRI